MGRWRKKGKRTRKSTMGRVTWGEMKSEQKRSERDEGCEWESREKTGLRDGNKEEETKVERDRKGRQKE